MREERRELPTGGLIEPPLDENARRVLEARYQERDATGRPVEPARELFWRVARGVAAAEAAFGGDPAVAAAELYPWIANLVFLPNSPTLMNAGRPQVGQLAACFVLPVEDTIDAIFRSVGEAARIQRTGGGTGFSFSRLRPRGDIVATTGGRASGPVSFLKVFNAATDAIHQGGVRRGANMGVLRVDHPDVLEFVDVKSDPRELKNFNLSVAATDAFMQAVREDGEYALVNPRNGQPTTSLRAREVFERIARRACESGEPGLIFIDRVNAANPTSAEHGEMESTNPCVPGDTWVFTVEGPRQVRDIVGKAVEVLLDGEAHASKEGFFQTGIRPVFEVTSEEGYRFSATEDHLVLTVSELSRYKRKTEWKRVGDLRAGDLLALNDHRALGGWPGDGEEHEGFLLGVLLGDGCLTDQAGTIDVWGDAIGANALRAVVQTAAFQLKHRADFAGFQAKRPRGSTRLKSAPLRELAATYGMSRRRKTPGPAVEQSSAAFHRGFLRGLFDTDGSVQGDQTHGVSVRLAQSDLGVLELAQRMLLRLGIASRIYRERRPAGFTLLPNGRGGTAPYANKAQHELVVSCENLTRYAELIGFADADKQAHLMDLLAGYRRVLNRERFAARVRSVEPRGQEVVYDIRVAGKNAFDGNGLTLHNCGESPLLPYESCNLGSIDVSKLITADGKDLDWERLRGAVRAGIRFLDDVIEANRYPVPEIEKITKANRKVGLGVMGFADLLIALGVRYDSEAGVDWARRIMRAIQAEAVETSRRLAEERGAFPSFPGSIFARRGEPPRRNATVTTIAPTGTIALIAGCSSGIEPVFALAYVRRALDGAALLPYVHPALERVARVRGFWTPQLAEQVARTGMLAGVPGVPADVREVFRTALEIAPEWHVRMQAAFQESVENAVSKTINLPGDSTPEDVERAYLLAYELGCKGITVYRDGSRAEQVLSVPPPAAQKPALVPLELEGPSGAAEGKVCGIEGCG